METGRDLGEGRVPGAHMCSTTETSGLRDWVQYVGKGIRYRQSILTRDEWAEGWGEIYDMGSMIPYPVQSILTGNAHPVCLVYTSGSIHIQYVPDKHPVRLDYPPSAFRNHINMVTEYTRY